MRQGERTYLYFQILANQRFQVFCRKNTTQFSMSTLTKEATLVSFRFWTTGFLARPTALNVCVFHSFHLKWKISVEFIIHSQKKIKFTLFVNDFFFDSESEPHSDCLHLARTERLAAAFLDAASANRRNSNYISREFQIQANRDIFLLTSKDLFWLFVIT